MIDDVVLPDIDTVIESYELEAMERAEREGLFWALKVSDVGAALLKLWRDEIDDYTRRLKKTRPDDPYEITKLQALIYTRENWLLRVDAATEPETEAPREA